MPCCKARSRKYEVEISYAITRGVYICFQPATCVIGYLPYHHDDPKVISRWYSENRNQHNMDDINIYNHFLIC